MSEIGVLVVFLFIVVIPGAVLYLAIDRETAEPTVVNRSEAEQIARDRGGRPDAREGDKSGRSGDDDGEWGATDEWGDRDRR